MLDDYDYDHDYERAHDYDYDYERDHEYDHDYKFPRMQASLHSVTRHSPPHTAGDGATKCSSMRANFERGGNERSAPRVVPWRRRFSEAPPPPPSQAHSCTSMHIHNYDYERS